MNSRRDEEVISMKQNGTVLLYEPDGKNREELVNLLQEKGFTVKSAETIGQLESLILSTKPVGVLVAVHNETEYQQVIGLCNKFERWRDMPIVIINRFSSDFQYTVDAISSGAYEHMLSHTTNAEVVTRFTAAVNYIHNWRSETVDVQEDAGTGISKAHQPEPQSSTEESETTTPSELKEKSPSLPTSTGELSSISFGELVEFFQNQLFDGKLIINSSTGNAELEFRNGELEMAVAEDKTDLDAFYEISKWKDGKFWIIYNGKYMSPYEFNDLREQGIPVTLIEKEATMEKPPAEAEPQQPVQPEGGMFEEPAPSDLERLLAETEKQAEAELQQPVQPEGGMFEEPAPSDLEQLLAETEKQAEAELQQPVQPEGGMFEEPAPSDLEQLLAETEKQAEAELQQPVQPGGDMFKEPAPSELEQPVEIETASVEKEAGEQEELDKLIQAAEEAETLIKKHTVEEQELSTAEEVWEEFPADIRKKFREIVSVIPTIRFACVLDLFHNKWTYYALEPQGVEELRETFVNILRNSEVTVGGGLKEIFGIARGYSFMLFSFKDGKYYLGVKVVTADNPIGAVRLTVREIIRNLENIF